MKSINNLAKKLQNIIFQNILDNIPKNLKLKKRKLMEL